MGKIYMIIGKSATGKDHIYKELARDKTLGLKRVVIYTTRPMRDGEISGEEYFFTDINQLNSLRQAGKIIEERVYNTAFGPWHYFTVDDGQIDLNKSNYLIIGTLDSLMDMQRYFSREKVVPLYIEVSDINRLTRSLEREKSQTEPKYEEVCRRYLSDQEDFKPEKIRGLGITRKFENNNPIEECIDNIREFVKEDLK